MISLEYGWLARQRYAAVTAPVGMDAGQTTQPFRGAAVPWRVRVRWNPGVRVPKVEYKKGTCLREMLQESWEIFDFRLVSLASEV